MFSVRAATFAAFAGLALIPSFAKAQDTPPPATPATPPVNLPPITVSAGRGSALDKLDVSTTLMTREQIQALPETGVDQIVNRIPGVWLPNIPTGQLHPTAQPVNIRGFGTSTTINTLVMVDGVPINDPYFRTINWSTIPKNSVERIEVIRGGGATSLWGNMAMGGVINIVTREPNRTGASADVSYGSYNTANAEVAGSVVVNDNVKIGVSYNHAPELGLQPHARAVPERQPGADRVEGRQCRRQRLPDAQRQAEGLRQGLLEPDLRGRAGLDLRPQQLVDLSPADGRQLPDRRPVLDQRQRLGGRRLVRHHQRGERQLHAEQHHRRPTSSSARSRPRPTPTRAARSSTRRISAPCATSRSASMRAAR